MSGRLCAMNRFSESEDVMENWDECDKTIECCHDLHGNQERFAGSKMFGGGMTHCPLIFGNHVCGANGPNMTAVWLYKKLKEERAALKEAKQEAKVKIESILGFINDYDR